MKKLTMISVILIAAFMVAGCIPAFFGKMDQKDDWHGFMSTDTFMRYQEHKILMEGQNLALAERKLALAERDSALAKEAQTPSATQNQGKTEKEYPYKGWMANEMGSTRTAQIIEVLVISNENYRELGVFRAVRFPKESTAVINLPEGYYIIKWLDGDFLTQTDKIQALPHRTVDVVKTGGAMEKYHFFSVCRR